MSISRTAAVLAIGDELLSGDVVDTNSAWLDAELGRRGVVVGEHRTVPDDVEAIALAIDDLTARHPLVVVTGGLGPTDDDLTLEAVAKAAAVPRELHVKTWAAIEARYRKKGSTARPGHRRQAELPRGATVLPNPIGTAPGLCLRLRRAELFVLPGVPGEMRALFTAEVASRLQSAGGRRPPRVVSAIGLGESDLEAEVRDLASPGVRFGYRSRGPLQQVRLYGGEPAELDGISARIRVRLGERYAGDDVELATAVGQRLRERGRTVAVAESCTGGGLGQALTRMPGSSAYFLGGIIAYANDVKVRLLGVPESLLTEHGAVSAAVAVAMAEGSRRAIGADVGLATTGVAGPGGGTADKPVGLVWLARSGPGESAARELRLTGDRSEVRRKTIEAALAWLWSD